MGALLQDSYSTSTATVAPTSYPLSSFGPVGTADDGPTLQTAINTVGAAGGGDIIIPRGSFSYVTAPTLNYSNVWIKGIGKGATVLNWLTRNPLQIFGTQPNGDGSTIQNVVNTGLQDLTIQGSQSISNQFLLSLKWFGSVSANGVTVRRCALNGDTNRTVILGAPNNVIEQWGLLFEEVDFIGHTSTNAFEAVLLRDCERIEFYKCLWQNFQYATVNLFTQLYDVTFDTCTSDGGFPEFTGGGGQLGTAGGIVVKKSTSKLTVINSLFRGIWGSPALFDGEGAGSPDNYGWTGGENWVIAGNTFYDCQAGIELPGLQHFEVEDNTFDRLQTSGIRVGTSGFHAYQGSIRRNMFRNLGQAGGGHAFQCAVYIKAAAANNTSNAVAIERNTMVDDQVTQTMTDGVVLDINANRTLYGYKIVDNDMGTIASQVRVLSGQFDPSTCQIERNQGLNPQYTLAGPALVSGKAVQPTFNARSRLILGSNGATITNISVGNLPPAPSTPVTNPIGSVAVQDLTNGLGSLWTVSANNATVSPVYRNANGGTEQGSVSPTFSIANTTDQLLISPIATPTVAPTLTAVNGVYQYPAGTYTVGYTWYNDTGETPLSPTANVVLSGANLQINFDISTVTVPSGALGCKVYITASTGSPVIKGLVQICPINALNVPKVNAVQINQLPFGIQPPTVSPVVTDGGLPPSPPNTGFNGTYKVAITYVTTNNWESAPGPATAGTVIAAGDMIAIAALNLDTFALKAGGQMAVSKVRYYLVGTSPQLGLIAEQYIQLPSSPATPTAFVPALTIKGILSSATAPSYDVSKPPDQQAVAIPAGTCGWRVPTGTTTMRFFISQNAGAVVQTTNVNPVGGVVRAFIIGTPGATVAIPTTNGTGVTIATAAPVTPLIIPLPPGEAWQATFTVATPTTTYVAE